MDTVLDSTAEVRRITAAEYWQVADVLDLDRVELIDGVLFRMSPESSKHIRAVVEVFDVLRSRYPDRQVLPGGSVELGSDLVWTPDVVVLDASPAKEFDPCPKAADVLLVVEIAISTWARDTGWKLRGYAASGVPEYWVIRPIANAWELTRFTEPAGDSFGRSVTVPLATPGALPLP